MVDEEVRILWTLLLYVLRIDNRHTLEDRWDDLQFLPLWQPLSSVKDTSTILNTILITYSSSVLTRENKVSIREFTV